MRIRQSCLPVRGISNLPVAEKLKIKGEYFVKQQKQGSLISTRLPRYSYTRYQIWRAFRPVPCFSTSASRDTKAGTKVDGKKTPCILQFTFTDWNNLLLESLATSAGWTQQRKMWIRGWLSQAWMGYLIETVPLSFMKSFSPPHFNETLSHSKIWKHLCSFFLLHCGKWYHVPQPLTSSPSVGVSHHLLQLFFFDLEPHSVVIGFINSFRVAMLSVFQIGL